MASRKGRAAPLRPPGASSSISLQEALNKLGMTHQEFQARQAELQTNLLQNVPFEPAPSTRYVPPLEKPKFDRINGARSRSGSESSSSSRASSPSIIRTPSKRGLVDTVSSRPRDHMEFVLEAQNRRKEFQRRGSTSRSCDSERVFHTPSHPTERAPGTDLPPSTPHHYKYYSERVVGEASASKHHKGTGLVPDTPSRDRGQEYFKMPLPRYLIPKTPSRHDSESSCPPTPRSSPPPMVNLVSSPGPMRPTPPEEEHLPFELPAGPYSEIKPDLSYAAIIGRAILASPGHALALQDIYEYITTVFPYYKRGEQTWMNSVRHALSTMAVFRKMQREPTQGKSLWAIYDQDVPCFADGGFKKQLCNDMANGTGGGRGSKRRSSDDVGGLRLKRRKTSDGPPVPTPMKPPFFPHYTQSANHQSYYQAACIQQQQIPAETLFPPLPASSNYHRVVARAASLPVAGGALLVSASGPSTQDGTETELKENLIPSFSPIERPPSSSSLPDLISSLSTSSSPTLSSHLSLHDESSREPSPAICLIPSSAMTTPTEDEEDPMASWLRSDSPLPGTSLAASSKSKDKGKGKARARSPATPERRPLQMVAPMQPPSSPTPDRRRTVASQFGQFGPPIWGQKIPPQDVSLGLPTRVQQPSPGSVVRLAELMRGMDDGGSPSPLYLSLFGSAQVDATTSDDDEAFDRPSTPEQPVTPPPPSTPVPAHLAQLEAELIDFSPLNSSLPNDLGRLPMSATFLQQSPSLSVFTSRAPLLRMGSMDEFLTEDPAPSMMRSPAAPPKTPKKSPFGAGSSMQAFRIMSPLGTPSRSVRDATSSGFDEDLAQLFRSPDGLFSGFTAGGAADSGSPGVYTRW